jgi:hypothetical protein
MHTILYPIRIGVDIDDAAIIPGIGLLMGVAMTGQTAFIGDDVFPSDWVESRGWCFPQDGQFILGTMNRG